MNLQNPFPSSLRFQLGQISLEPTYVQAGLIIFLIFVLILTMARVRRHFLDWSFKGSIFGIALGFILALILEGFLLIGGRTVVTEVLGWQNAPKPIQEALESGNTKLRDVLGIEDSSSCE